jgi:hypothetical protein
MKPALALHRDVFELGYHSLLHSTLSELQLHEIRCQFLLGLPQPCQFRCRNIQISLGVVTFSCPVQLSP